MPLPPQSTALLRCPEQLAMAEHVAAARDGRETLVVEAGTGTGKTFASCVTALASGRCVIVPTGTRDLQDQLFHRDLPAICGALGRPGRVALPKVRAWSHVTRRGDIAELTGPGESDPV